MRSATWRTRHLSDRSTDDRWRSRRHAPCSDPTNLSSDARLPQAGDQSWLIIGGLHAALALPIGSPLAHALQDVGLLRLKFLWILLHASAQRLRIVGGLYAALPFLDFGEPLAQLFEDLGFLGLKFSAAPALPVERRALA
jgi:hypothetical protein